MKTRKLFMVASIAAVAGVLTTTAVPGCSSSSEPTTEGTDASTVTDARPIVPKETGPEEPEEAAPKTCPNTTPITEADIQLKWKPPPPAQSVCLQEDIDKLKAAFKASTTGVKYSDMKTALGATCASCVFSPSTDAGLASEWSTYVESSAPGAAAVTAFNNAAASCFARQKDNACGKARFNFEQCLRTACVKEDPAKPELGGCKTDSAVQTCNGAPAQGGPCKALTDVYVAACPEEADYLKACNNVFASIAVNCAGGTDAGIDSSAP